MLRSYSFLLKPNLVARPLLAIRKFAEKTNEPEQLKKVGIVLSGCGVQDGTEIHEAAATAAHLTRLELEPVFYALDIPQTEVVNHDTGETVNESRNMFVESARIARGKICKLKDLEYCHVDGLVFPGGFGVAKHLSTYAKEGVDFTINEEVSRIINEFHDTKKPMGFMCIAPILPAKLIPQVKVTFGKKGEKWPFSSAIEDAKKMGAEVEFHEVDEYAFDKAHLIFSTPAFMYDGKFHEIYHGIGIMLEHMYQVI